MAEAAVLKRSNPISTANQKTQYLVAPDDSMVQRITHPVRLCAIALPR